MSVLACDRAKCENIMCDRLILEGSAYICNSCYDELIVYKSTWPNNMSTNEVRAHIEMFMNTKPGEYIGDNEASIDYEFERLTNG